MIELNLTANGKEQTIIKQFLENNVSETLAEKINNGVKFEKDNKNLTSKKDLNGFLKFANNEARKLAEKNANCTCVEDETVFGWAIHYFEEDIIEGTLYNEDGTEYIPKTAIPKVETKQRPEEEKKQQSLFDFMELSTKNEEKVEENEVEKESANEEFEENEDDDWSEEDKLEAIKQEVEKDIVIDTETGEVIESAPNKTSSVDKDYATILSSLLDGKLEVR